MPWKKGSYSRKNYKYRSYKARYRRSSKYVTNASLSSRVNRIINADAEKKIFLTPDIPASEIMTVNGAWNAQSQFCYNV